MIRVRAKLGVRPRFSRYRNYPSKDCRPDISDEVNLMTTRCNPEQDPHARHRPSKSVRSPPEIFQIERTMHVVMPKNEFHAPNGRKSNG